MKIFVKAAFVAIALSTVLSSCVRMDPEPVLDPGFAQINVVVKTTFGDVVTNLANVVVTSNNLGDNTLAYADGYALLLGNVNGNKTINPQTLIFKATYDGYETTGYVTVNKILPGSSLYTNILLVLGPTPADFYVKLESTSQTDHTYAYLAKATYEYISIALGRKVLLMENNTEYKFERNETVLVRNGFDVIDWDDLEPEIVKEKAEAYRGDIKEETKEQHIVVSAWSVYGLERDYQYYTETYGVYKVGFDERVGGFQVEHHATAVNYLEYAHPSHAAHYIAGHGKSITHAGHAVHGASEHAGGGIVTPL